MHTRMKVSGNDMIDSLKVAVRGSEGDLFEILESNEIHPSTILLPDGSTALHIASRGGRWELVIMLIEHGANVFARDTNLNMPIDVAEDFSNSDPHRYCMLVLRQEMDNIRARDNFVRARG